MHHASLMARTVTTHITDDIDGTADAHEVSFAFEGTNYTVDLGKKNRAAFEKALKPYIEAATKVGRERSGSRRTSKNTADKYDLNQVRTWARENGIEVSDRGRVAKAVLDQYDAAH